MRFNKMLRKENIVASISACTSFITHIPFKALFMLGLIISARSNTLNDHADHLLLDNTSAPDFPELVYPIEYCRGQIETINKPTDLQVGARNGAIISVSCLGDASEKDQCANDKKLLAQHYKNTALKEKNKKLKDMRNEVQARINQWGEGIATKMDEIILSFPIEYRSNVEQILKLKLTEIKLLEIRAKTITTYGNCEENTTKAIFGLLALNSKSLKIQKFTLNSPKSDAVLSTNDHTYVMLHSNANDTEIKNDKRAVGAYLNSISNGLICDPWNNGFFSDVSKNAAAIRNNGLYHAETAEWNYIRVKTYDLDFKFNELLSKVINSLNDYQKQKKVETNQIKIEKIKAHIQKLKKLKTALEGAQQFVCDQLGEMGLKPEGSNCTPRLN